MTDRSASHDRTPSGLAGTIMVALLWVASGLVVGVMLVLPEQGDPVSWFIAVALPVFTTISFLVLRQLEERIEGVFDRFKVLSCYAILVAMYGLVGWEYSEWLHPNAQSGAQGRLVAAIIAGVMSTGPYVAADRMWGSRRDDRDDFLPQVADHKDEHSHHSRS